MALNEEAGIGIALISFNCWSLMSSTSGAKAENVPVWEAVLTAFHPQPPGTHCATTEEKVFRVPLSKPSPNSVETGPHVGVGVAEGVGVGVVEGATVAVAVAVAVGVGEAVAVAVAVGVAAGVGLGQPAPSV